VACLRSGKTPSLGAANALRSAEIVFACYESSRRRGRVDLPLDKDDNALEALHRQKAFKPARRPKRMGYEWLL
jgi:hypothetical protein